MLKMFFTLKWFFGELLTKRIFVESNKILWLNAQDKMQSYKAAKVQEEVQIDAF